MFGGNFKMSLSLVQQEIVDTPGNVIVSASAGTGKTHTMVAKIEKDLKENHSHKVIAAITFTVKAAKEIRARVNFDVSESFIGTNNSFAIEEIIKPFAKDVYGNKFKIDMNTNYSIKRETFKDCLDYLRDTHTICTYKNNRENFVFELALEIIKKSKVCRLFLQSKYFKIYVDEYQDCDKTMHKFFMYLCNQLHIEFFVVGDEKQSIYMWRGAYPDAFKEILKMPNFHNRISRENYRSCQQIQNYSNLLSEETSNLYKPLYDKSAIVLILTKLSDWGTVISQYFQSDMTCALLRYKRDDARNGAMTLSENGVPFTFIPRPPISDITTDVSWLYNAIAQYCIIPKYSIYDFVDEIPEESIGDRHIIAFLNRKLSSIKKALETEDNNVIITEVEQIASYFGYQTSENHIQDMIKTIKNEEYHPAFNMENLKHIAITFHSSKGLEFDQVILFANDYTLKEESDIYNHYVAVTRAKSKLIIVQITDNNGWKGILYWENLTKLFKNAGIDPESVMTIRKYV